MDKVLIVTTPNVLTPGDWEELGKIVQVDYFEKDKITEAELLEALKGYDHLMLNYEVNNDISENFYSKLKEINPEFKSISFDYTALTRVHPQKAHESGIIIQNIPYYSTVSVAEFIMLSLLLHARGLSDFFNKIRIDGEISYEDKKNIALFGKKIGIIGLGNIGLRVAKLAQGFDMEVLGWNRTPKEFPSYIQYSNDLSKVLSESDFVILTVSGNKETIGMFNYDLLSKTKKGVIIINHGTHNVVNFTDLKKLIEEKHIAGYSAVYYDLEEAGLTKYKEVTALPHYAWHTEHSLQTLRKIWVENIINAIEGKFPNKV